MHIRDANSTAAQAKTHARHAYRRFARRGVGQGHHPRPDRRDRCFGGVGYALEYAGPAIASLSMEARMTLCNMSIEAGSRVGMIAPDETTFAYLKGRPLAPASAQWDEAVAHWRSMRTDDDAVFDREVAFDVSKLVPRVSWGTTPEENLPITATIPDPMAEADSGTSRADAAQSQLYGTYTRYQAQRHHHQSRLHRLLYQ